MTGVHWSVFTSRNMGGVGGCRRYPSRACRISTPKRLRLSLLNLMRKSLLTSAVSPRTDRKRTTTKLTNKSILIQMSLKTESTNDWAFEHDSEI